MAKRSLKASQKGIIRAKEAFDRTGWTQEYLAAEVGLSSRQSVWKFFTGRPIERYLFKEICFKLNLEWEDIADLPSSLLSSESIELEEEADNSNSWVEHIRAHLKEQIQTQCNSLQSAFDLTQPSLEEIYILINLFPQPSSQRWLEVNDFQYNQLSLERPSLTHHHQEAVSAMQIAGQYDKLMILGKPGGGKTTFLQYIALQCNKGQFKPHLIPLFIQLRTLIVENVEEDENSNLMKFILSIGEKSNISSEKILQLLQEGRFLFLLDGLDEVTDINSEALFQEIEQLSQSYYKNTIFMTCRSGIQKYYFRGFTYVELADFNPQQIEAFARNWFIATANSKEEGSKKAEQFFEHLERPANKPIRDLAATPILLNLICSVFKEKASFPTKRYRLYQAGLDILLQKWDQARGIQRDGIYRDLSLADKIKLLCQIASLTFNNNQYFFDINDILYIIEDYLRNLPNSSTDPETLWLNSEAVLKAIEIQHGLLVERAKDVYSFSHLTFQEYLTARKIIASHGQENLNKELVKLADRSFEPQWREVILLTISMLPRADFLVQEINTRVKHLSLEDKILQQFLRDIEAKVNSMQIPYKPAAVRAFYFTLLQNRDLNLAIALDVKFAGMDDLPEELNLDLTLVRAFTDSLNLLKSPELNMKKFLNFCFSLDLERKFNLASSLKADMQDLKGKLPSLEQSRESIQSWWRDNGQDWVDSFRSILNEHRKICQDLNLTRLQQENWQKYYRGNQFIVECVQSDCQVSPAIKKEIEENILLL